VSEFSFLIKVLSRLECLKSNAMPISVLDDSWIEHDFQDEDLLGSLLNLYMLMNFSCGGTLSVQLSAMTSREDPEPFASQNPDHTMALEAARMDPVYQQEISGAPPTHAWKGIYQILMSSM
jgi:hypothetical protein